jgi:hypothetical protein
LNFDRNIKIKHGENATLGINLNVFRIS